MDKIIYWVEPGWYAERQRTFNKQNYIVAYFCGIDRDESNQHAFSSGLGTIFWLDNEQSYYNQK